MRKNLLSCCIITLFLLTAGHAAVAALQNPDAGLRLESPTTCPTGGCAAGQRLNFTLGFSVNPQYNRGPNTQVCIYAPADGQGGAGTQPWADFSNGWIAENSSNPAFTQGEQGSVCSSAAPVNTELLTGAYAKFSAAQNGLVRLAFHINRSTDTTGTVSAKIFQVESNGTTWKETTDAAGNYGVSISVAPVAQTAYAAELPASCGSKAPCYVQSGDDKALGMGTGLFDAINALTPGGTIYILKDLRLKTHPIEIDKYLLLRGFDEQSMLTSINSPEACGNSLLVFRSAGVLKDLTLNDGNCPASNSRDLVEIDSPNNVTIRKNTLSSGNIGIHVLNQAGTVDISFNEITNNLGNAVLIEPGSTDPGRVNIYANNILNNGSATQMNCHSGGMADHNFWGEGELPSENATNCIISNGKRLGAPILSSLNSHGVQAVLSTVTGSFSSYFNGRIGVRHTAGENYDLIIVNHGQGSHMNNPFFESGSGEIVSCSSFFDIFLANDADPKNLEVAINYDLSNFCIDIMESEFYCGSASQDRYPLWWYDPVNNVTDGWDRTGQAPQGPGGGGDAGQVTTCNIDQDQIIVKIDNTGRPGLLSDLTFTPFTTGYIEGATLIDFKAEFINFYSKISWQTSREKNIKQYRVLKSETSEGPFKIITTVDVDDDSNTATTYQFYDYDVKLLQTYYYQLQVIHNSADSETIGLHGPVMLQVPGPTITNTPTVTRTPYPSSTPIYRTPTRPYYRSATPEGIPTPVRTYGPSPTGATKPPFIPSPTSTITPDAGYPVEGTSTATESAYPLPGSPTLTPTQTMEGREGTTTPGVEGTAENGGEHDQQEGSQPASPRLAHVFIGLGTGLILLLSASLLLARIYFW